MTLLDPFVAFDLETTGVDPFSDVPVSYAIVSSDLKMVELINPGCSIPEGLVLYMVLLTIMLRMLWTLIYLSTI